MENPLELQGGVAAGKAVLADGCAMMLRGNVSMVRRPTTWRPASAMGMTSPNVVIGNGRIASRLIHSLSRYFFTCLKPESVGVAHRSGSKETTTVFRSSTVKND